MKEVLTGFGVTPDTLATLLSFAMLEDMVKEFEQAIFFGSTVGLTDKEMLEGCVTFKGPQR